MLFQPLRGEKRGKTTHRKRLLTGGGKQKKPREDNLICFEENRFIPVNNDKTGEGGREKKRKKEKDRLTRKIRGGQKVLTPAIIQGRIQKDLTPRMEGGKEGGEGRGFVIASRRKLGARASRVKKGNARNRPGV